MVQVTCKRTGIEFTAKTARSETHPVIASLLKTAFERRCSGAASAVIESLRQSGCQDLATYEAAIRQAMETPGERYARFGKNSYAAQHPSSDEAYWARLAGEGRTIESN